MSIKQILKMAEMLELDPIDEGVMKDPMFWDSVDTRKYDVAGNPIFESDATDSTRNNKPFLDELPSPPSPSPPPPLRLSKF